MGVARIQRPWAVKQTRYSKCSEPTSSVNKNTSNVQFIQPSDSRQTPYANRGNGQGLRKSFLSLQLTSSERTQTQTWASETQVFCQRECVVKADDDGQPTQQEIEHSVLLPHSFPAYLWPVFLPTFKLVQPSVGRWSGLKGGWTWPGIFWTKWEASNHG